MLFPYIVFIFILSLSVANKVTHRYWQIRDNILKKEAKQSLGGDVVLNDLEKQVNKVLLRIKNEELLTSYTNTTLYPPAWIFTDVKKSIEKSELFRLIKMLPKGSSLHSHLTASVSFEYVFWNLTYMKDLYVCKDKNKIYFFRDGMQNDICKWQKLEELRKNDPTINHWLANRMSINLNTRKRYGNYIEVWNNFLSLFGTYNGLVSYIPVYEFYVYQSLKELYDDNVLYAEFRANFWEIYDLDNIYDPDKFIQIFINVVQKFQKDYPEFIGAKLIFSPSRKMDDKNFKESVDVYLKMQRKYPDHLVGFDLVGFEDNGRPLKDRVEDLYPLRKKINFVFHSGETNWNGFDVDENLIDAILLGSKRIGHAYALEKHPQLLKAVKKRKIGLEISPISNQMLLLVDDLRNHPAVNYAAMGLPIVVCNDDPGLWGAKGLSYDWYLAFLAFSKKNEGLAFLKQLALNSINQSMMRPEERRRALEVFEAQWLNFLRMVYTETIAYNNTDVKNNEEHVVR